MKLSTQDAELFYKLMWRLQFYVNQQRKIVPGVDSVEQYQTLHYEKKQQIRTVLYDNPELIDSFVEENPFKLSAGELNIVRSWKRFVKGNFYIERHLKKHSIWIGGDPSKVYAVLGIQDSLDDVFFGRPTPIMVEGVLLPFKDQIIYDGLLSTYNIFFGGGIKGNLREDYLAAKQNRRIITSLEPGAEKAGLPDEPIRDWQPQLDAIIAATQKLQGEKAPLQAAAFSLIKAAANLTQAAISTPDDIDALWKRYDSVSRSLKKLHTVLARAES